MNVFKGFCEAVIKWNFGEISLLIFKEEEISEWRTRLLQGFDGVDSMKCSISQSKTFDKFIQTSDVCSQDKFVQTNTNDACSKNQFVQTPAACSKDKLVETNHFDVSPKNSYLAVYPECKFNFFIYLNFKLPKKL